MELSKGTISPQQPMLRKAGLELSNIVLIVVHLPGPRPVATNQRGIRCCKVFRGRAELLLHAGASESSAGIKIAYDCGANDGRCRVQGCDSAWVAHLP